MRVIVALAWSGLALGALACERPTPNGAAPDAAAPPASARPSLAIGRIVFLDQVEACECTRNRIEASWRELQAALAARPGLPVDRIHLDEQAEAAKVYLEMHPLMVTPGIYFMDTQENLAAQLQGEVTRAQVAAVLEKR